MNNRLDFISTKADHLLDLMKNDNHSGKSNTTVLFLIVVYVIIATAHLIIFNFTPLLGVSLVLLVALMVIFRMSMQSAIKENADSSNYESYKEVDTVTYLKTKLQYLYSGVVIKFTRTRSIRVLYSVIFPFILLMGKEVFGKEITSWISTIILAILLGGLFWWYYFREEIEDLDIAKDDIKGFLEGV